MSKLFREHFSGIEPLYPSKEECDSMVSALRQRFEGDDWVDTTRESWMSQERRDRHLQTLFLQQPDRRYYYSTDSFRLMLADDGGLVLESSGVTARVSSLDEVLAVIAECKRRLERQGALRKRREKVRGFKQRAMIEQIKELARQEGFDFATEFTTQRIKLWIKLNEKEEAVEIFIPPKRFQDVLPQLPRVIRLLRECFEVGLSFKTTNRRSLPWGTQWITFRDADEEKESGYNG